jgi:uncharacterized protein (UPF0332 family)
MESWLELSVDNRTASHELFHARRWRSCVNRCYYGVYARCADALLEAGVVMRHGKQNPDHPPWLSQVIGNNLQNHLPDASRRWELASLIKTLFDLRVVADYKPHITLTEDEARVAMGLAAKAHALLTP